MSGLEVAQGIGYAKSTLVAIVEAKGRYELIEGIVKDAPDYRQRLSDLENVLGQVHRVFSDSLDILNANKEMRQSLVRGLRNCRDPISEINKKLMSINAKRTHPERLYKASEWNVKLSQHHTKLDSAKLTLLIAMNTINMDMTNSGMTTWPRQYGVQPSQSRYTNYFGDWLDDLGSR